MRRKQESPSVATAKVPGAEESSCLSSEAASVWSLVSQAVSSSAAATVPQGATSQPSAMHEAAVWTSPTPGFSDDAAMVQNLLHLHRATSSVSSSASGAAREAKSAQPAATIVGAPAHLLTARIDSATKEAHPEGEPSPSAMLGEDAASLSRIVNGPQGMNNTLMSEANLPNASRHVNGVTLAADWMAEYGVSETKEAVEGLPPVLKNPWTGALLVFFTLFAAGVVLLTLGYLA